MVVCMCVIVGVAGSELVDVCVQGYLGPQAVLRPAAGWKKNGPSSTEQTSEGSKLGGKAVSR